MPNTVRIAPSYSLIFVSDVSGGTSPECTDGKNLWATPSCIAVACLMFQDGETEIRLGPARDVDPGGRPVFDGGLETPNRTVIISTAEQEVVLDARVASQNTRVRIWTNHPTEPDRIVVGLG